MPATPDNNWYSNEAATFGDRVAAAREVQDMTQKSLAHRLGVAEKTVIGWEDDLTEPRANKLQMLSGVLNVSIPWLLTGDGQGLADPDEASMPTALNDLMTEMRVLRSDMSRAADRMGVLEKRLKVALSEPAL